jgi:cobalt/nickel transport system permease protein
VAAGHVRDLLIPSDTPVHRLPPECKIAAVAAFVLVVVATPRTWFAAFAGYAALLLLVALEARVPLPTVARRTAIEAPFVAFAVLLPFVASGERVEVLGVAVSEPGLLGAWNILAKGTLGVVASVLLVSTTDSRALLLGLQRLRLPRRLVEIAAFMLRYADVIAAEMGRMRVARAARCFQPRSVRQLRAVAHSAGALFIRCYERGERVYLAMLSRGYSGQLPAGPAGAGTAAGSWAAAAALPVAAAGVLLLAGTLR